MKKMFLLFVLLIAGVAGLRAQTTLYSTDFESYTVGGKVAQQAGAPWTTWSNAPGGAEDGTISGTQAHNGTKSVYIVNDNDLVLNLYDKTSGRYKLEWYMFVVTGKLGYFNVLSDFAGNNSAWAFQVYMYHDSISVDADGISKVKAPYSTNNWKLIQLIIDLDDDFATFYVDNVELVSYQWSKGAQGTDDIHKLDGIDFYGWSGGTGTPVASGTAGYFIDDLKIDSVAAPEAPVNLTAVLNGLDVDVSWNAPTSTPDIYKLSRNGSVINASTNLSYTDIAPWPNTYIYGVRAHYTGQGYSHSSNTDTAIVPGGVTRNFVLMEGGTGTWCQYCPGAAMGLRDLIEVNNKDAVAIEYHNGDTYEFADGNTRLAYYNITAFPTMVVDGTQQAVGGNATQSLYPAYLPMYNERISMPSHHIVNMNIVQTATDNYSATITIEQTFSSFSSGLKLHTALTESNIAENWQNQTEVDFACRGMYPNASGTALDFSVVDTQSVTINFSTTGFVKNNCQFVAFVQHETSKEVTQTAMIELSSIVGIKEIQGKQIRIYPNPASDFLMVLSAGKGHIEIFDMTGKKVYTSEIFRQTEVIGLNGFRKGVYSVRLISDEKIFTEKLIIE
ncbi:MAG: T9SS type A sorting domain-containing protein [Bacteroidia bacterium]|nr:T9SS type A sorting domain-containing protein [Bacteroidia bacterium]